MWVYCLWYLPDTLRYGYIQVLPMNIMRPGNWLPLLGNRDDITFVWIEGYYPILFLLQLFEPSFRTLISSLDPIVLYSKQPSMNCLVLERTFVGRAYVYVKNNSVGVWHYQCKPFIQYLTDSAPSFIPNIKTLYNVLGSGYVANRTC